jgi:transposase InsO family protein
MVCSMSREGNCWDNAPIESWFNSFKNERYDGIRYATHDAMKAASFEPRISIRICDEDGCTFRACFDANEALIARY